MLNVEVSSRFLQSSARNLTVSKRNNDLLGKLRIASGPPKGRPFGAFNLPSNSSDVVNAQFLHVIFF